ncbi:MAG: outer membrane protein assembly factor BamB family protein [Gemmataceae bacterium]
MIFEIIWPLFRLALPIGCCMLATDARAAEPIATYRGNSQRTGGDGSAGPASPKVLWTWKSADHFIAAPVAHKDHLFVSGLGGFNVPVLTCLNVDPKTAKRVAWSKTTPSLKLPTVSSPAIHDGKLLFGDGMHQTDGAILHCLRLDKGRMLWQYPIPGTLVHLEGSPTLAGGRVYLGGGAAGVLCVDTNRVTLDGQEMALSAIEKLLDKKWAELQAKFEEEKKKNADLTVPPSEDDLPKPAPVLAWQQGKDKWHVDAPVAVAGDRVFAASAFLDKEKVGDRALFCLNAKNGSLVWRTPLSINPWGGPSLSGDVVVVSGSSIGYDPKQLKKARGSLAAYNLADGKMKWKKDVSAGIVSCAALTKELAIATATDGKVRAFDLHSGERRWIYDGKTPFFAPVALSSDIAYAGDLRGVVHAINLADGSDKWKLDLAADPVKTPGMIYGGPVLAGGRLYVATCNLEGSNARQPTVVVCIGE